MSTVLISERKKPTSHPNKTFESSKANLRESQTMSSKTVWVVGGLVLAIGAVAYLSYHETPAGKDAAGTIVEAKRAISESSSGGPPTSTNGSTDNGSTDRSGDKPTD